jgi:threonine dehydrogenase-like Zn-dependent dehydrogenase
MAPQATFVVQTAARTYELREAALPDIGPDDGLLSLEGCGVCGTDLEVFEGVLSSDGYPLVPGHEPFGRILKIGAAASARWQVSEGDRVAVHSTLTCGRCRTCRRGLRGCTAPEFADTTIYGFRSPDVAPALWGGFATHLYLAPEAIVVPLPERLSVAAASLFNVMSNGVDWVLEVGGMRAGMTVAILGPGPRGLASAIAARAGGAAEIAITGLTTDAERLEFALECGVDHAVAVEGEEAVDAVLSRLGRPPDLVVDCTPLSVSSVTDATRMVARRGVVVLAGMKGPDGMAPIPVDLVSTKQLTLKGAVSRSLESMELAIELLGQDRAPYDRFASHAFPIEKAEEALHSLSADHKPMHVRIVPYL